MTVKLDVHQEEGQQPQARGWMEEQSPIRQSAAEMAARAYSAAVRATELFITSLPGTPTDEDLARYTGLLKREDAAWQERREAFAALALRHEP
ncbi:hypothetical protein AB0H43_03780 [Hamadaea sp. NPDC050747]|uniref:hypothetical protein n=1 Tax=Hamadaea sp. NPDC050747 TaxID=3155789 RepID=UPI0033FFBEFC